MKCVPSCSPISKILRRVGMAQRGRRLRFAYETFHAVAIRSDIGGKDLQRYFAIELGVLREIHLTHSARADFGDDAVMREC